MKIFVGELYSKKMSTTVSKRAEPSMMTETQFDFEMIMKMKVNSPQVPQHESKEDKAGSRLPVRRPSS